MFVIILSSFNVSKNSNGNNLECSAIIKTLNVCSIRKEIYSHLKKKQYCAFPLITNYLSKEDYKINKNIVQNLYYKFTDLEKYYKSNNLGHLSVYGESKNIHIVLKKRINLNVNNKILIRTEMNNLVLRACNILSENINNNMSNDHFKKIRLADKYINNFITHQSNWDFVYRLYKEDEKKSTLFIK